MITLYVNNSSSSSNNCWVYGASSMNGAPRRDKRQKKPFQHDFGMVGGFRCRIENEIITIKDTTIYLPYEHRYKVIGMLGTPKWKAKCLSALKCADENIKNIAKKMLRL